MCRPAVSLEVVNTLLGNSILEGAHALHHLTFDLVGAVNFVGGQEMFRHWKGKGKEFPSFMYRRNLRDVECFSATFTSRQTFRVGCSQGAGPKAKVGGATKVNVTFGL